MDHPTAAPSIDDDDHEQLRHGALRHLVLVVPAVRGETHSWNPQRGLPQWGHPTNATWLEYGRSLAGGELPPGCGRDCRSVNGDRHGAAVETVLDENLTLTRYTDRRTRPARP
jgi:hypothetical protein